MSETLQNIFLLGCVLPVIVMFVLGILAVWFGKRWFDNFIEPDTEKLHAQYLSMKQHNSDDKQLINKIVRQQAMKCGIVGAVTGIGGFVTLPITLPIDVVLTAKMQASMVSFIAQAYGFETPMENKVATYAVMTGNNELAAISGRMIQKYLPRLFGKSFSKLIPFVGAFISFLLNYMLAQSVARVAIKWYENQSRADVLKAGEQVLAS